MTQFTTPGFIHARRLEPWDNEESTVEGFKLEIWPFQNMSERILVTSVAVTFDIPEAFNPRAQFSSVLEAEKRKLQAEFTARITELERQIQQMLAIE